VTKNKRLLATEHPLYETWRRMRQRCSNPNEAAYKYYGAKGVRVCQRWDENFWAFVEHISPRRSYRYSIDRYPNRHGNYEPGNWR
jgi:hypothetical protein